MKIGAACDRGAEQHDDQHPGPLRASARSTSQYHGATRLGANALLSCIFDGLFCGPGVANYVREGCRRSPPMCRRAPSTASSSRKSEGQALVDSAGREDGENPYIIAREMGEEMTAASTVVKTEERMLQAMDKLGELKRPVPA
jgi:succinate dehydrogenase / fumarate reductase flavoprotein subunit